MSGEKKPFSKINKKPENMEVDDYPLVSGDGSLHKPKQLNAVSFIDRPKLSKTKSLGPNKQQRSPEQPASKEVND